MARILLVDDEPLTSGMLRDIMADILGHQVALAQDGLQALQQLGVRPPDHLLLQAGVTDWKFLKNDWSTDASEIVLPDLVVTDCMMPRMDGFSLVTQMSMDDTVSRLPVIVLTSKTKMEEPFRQLSNVAGFLAKPISMERLQALLEQVLAKPR